MPSNVPTMFDKDPSLLQPLSQGNLADVSQAMDKAVSKALRLVNGCWSREAKVSFATVDKTLSQVIDWAIVSLFRFNLIFLSLITKNFRQASLRLAQLELSASLGPLDLSLNFNWQSN
jgi:hypothetical protein